jgi:hypothetical protein
VNAPRKFQAKLLFEPDQKVKDKITYLTINVRIILDGGDQLKFEFKITMSKVYSEFIFITFSFTHQKQNMG